MQNFHPAQSSPFFAQSVLQCAATWAEYHHPPRHIMVHNMVLYGTQYGTHMINACLMVHKRYTIWYTIQVELRTEGLTPRVGFRVLGYRESLGLRVKGED